MAKAILTAVLIVLVNVLVGCNDVDKGRGQLIPTQVKASQGSGTLISVAEPGEVDIVEQMSANRQAYRRGLVSLIENYSKTGNNMKLEWAKKELEALDAIPQYNYILEAGVAGPRLKATTSISEANYIYQDAVRLEKKARALVVINNENQLRLALDKYNHLIRKFPSSDKIDDAAYRAAKIYEDFKDYSIALVYYQRVYQWDPDTSYPAEFKAAYILDRRLHRRAEALELYQKAVKREGLSRAYRDFAEERINELTSSEKGEEQD